MNLQAILTTLEQACDVLGGVETRRHLLIGSDSIDLWFASAAWNLGRQVSTEPCLPMSNSS